MSHKANGWKKVQLAAALTGLALSISYALSWTPAGAFLDGKLYDVAVRANGAKPSEQIVVVYVDDFSKRQIPEPLVFWQLHYAEVIRSIAKAGARGVALDVIFALHPDQLPPGADQRLAQSYLEAVNEGTPVVMGIDRGAGIPRSRVYMAARSLDSIGILDFFPDQDDFIRRFPPCAQSEQETMASLGLKVAAQSMGEQIQCDTTRVRVGSKSLARDSDGLTLIGHRGRAYSFTHVSFFEVLSLARANQAEQLEKLFRGKIVFIGADDSQDRHATPFYSAGPGERRTPGVDIHASIAAMVLDDSAPTQAPPWGAFVMASVCTLLMTVVGLRVSWLTSAMVALLLMAAALGATTGLYAKHVSVAPTNALVGILVAYISVAVYRYRTEYRAKNELRKHFTRYVSDAVVDEIIHQGRVELGGTRQKVTVLFSDIRGFTTWSERTSPEILVLQLNEYLTAMTDVVMTNGGMVDKFIGDGILALFGAPLETREASWRACLTAVQMLEELARLNARWASQKRPTLQIGIGIHSGEAVVGNIGSPRKMDYTAVGDTVNTAARVEAQSKDAMQRYGVSIVITDATLKDLEAWDHHVDAEAIGIEMLKGKTDLTKLYILRALAKA